MSKELEIYVGMSIDLNGQPLVLAPKTPINKIKEKGLELELPDNVFLGNVGDMMEAAVNAVKPQNDPKPFKLEEFKKQYESVPVAGKLIQGITSADLTLNKFHVKKHPKEQGGDTDYTVAMVATWREKDKNKAVEYAYETELTTEMNAVAISASTAEKAEKAVKAAQEAAMAGTAAEKKKKEKAAQEAVKAAEKDQYELDQRNLEVAKKMLQETTTAQKPTVDNANSTKEQKTVAQDAIDEAEALVHEAQALLAAKDATSELGFNFDIKGIFVMFTNEMDGKNVDAAKAMEEAAAKAQKVLTAAKS